MCGVHEIWGEQSVENQSKPTTPKHVFKQNCRKVQDASLLLYPELLNFHGFALYCAFRLLLLSSENLQYISLHGLVIPSHSVRVNVNSLSQLKHLRTHALLQTIPFASAHCCDLPSTGTKALSLVPIYTTLDGQNLRKSWLSTKIS